ncbi:hypothetical protein NP493_441g01024 [Ridgeia piscesae]|uniref:Uncharacterized protein n=1 Tax=Ridgeia piscesae TaxID=27915 RepID=A0AAD9NTU9_RIDPI|nr:hypothetical protein NP493_441g01024 [Ridgeia piscesae]
MATSTPTFKVILCGEYGVGKSSIFRRFIDNTFTLETGPKSTVGLDHAVTEFNASGTQIRVELWDTAGIERFATLSSSYFQSASAAILCYSTTDRQSFNLVSQHILDIIMHSSTARIFLCGNKIDLAVLQGEQITESDVQDFQIQCDTVLSGTYEISCKTGEGVKEMFADIAMVLARNQKYKFDRSLMMPNIQPQENDECQKSGKCCS